MKIDFQPDLALHPFESRWFDCSAGRMHYIDEGSGTPILFCHGNPTWSFLYRGIVTRLRDQFRCVGVDYLGFGLSERPEAFDYTIAEHVRTVGELVDHLGLDGFIIMGQDWGGPVSTAVATDRADRISGVVLGNTWFWPATARFRLFSRVMGSTSCSGRSSRRTSSWRGSCPAPAPCGRFPPQPVRSPPTSRPNPPPEPTAGRPS